MIHVSYMFPFVFVWFLEKCFNESVWKLFVLLLYRMKAELEAINQQNTDAKLNTDKFLALTLPPSHNEGKKKKILLFTFFSVT